MRTHPAAQALAALLVSIAAFLPAFAAADGAPAHTFRYVLGSASGTDRTWVCTVDVQGAGLGYELLGDGRPYAGGVCYTPLPSAGFTMDLAASTGGHPVYYYQFSDLDEATGAFEPCSPTRDAQGPLTFPHAPGACDHLSVYAGLGSVAGNITITPGPGSVWPAWG